MKTNNLRDNSPSSIALSIAGSLRHLGNGDLADLRRLGTTATAPAYWRLAAQHDALDHQHAAWVPIVKALAMLTPKGPPGERPELNDPKRKFGAVLCDGGSLDWPGASSSTHSPRPVTSERRLAQLLAARGAQRITLLTRAVRMIASRRDLHVGLDVPDLAWAFLNSDRPDAIARHYYRRLDGAQRAFEHSESDKETVVDA